MASSVLWLSETRTWIGTRIRYTGFEERSHRHLGGMTEKLP